MSNDPALPDVAVTTKPKTREETLTRRVPPYNLILENDDHHSFEFVMGVLIKALGYTVERSFELTRQAHQQGRAVVWTGPKEVAELKLDQITTFHETRESDGKKLGPVGCVIEPAPGG
jgi:ATP-dependent Clp protease adaptor protein ClpS